MLLLQRAVHAGECVEVECGDAEAYAAECRQHTPTATTKQPLLPLLPLPPLPPPPSPPPLPLWQPLQMRCM